MYHYYINDIEYAFNILNIYHEKKGDQQELDNTVNKELLQEMNKIRTNNDKSPLPYFKCFMERKVQNGFEFCSVTPVLLGDSGVNVEKYLNVDYITSGESLRLNNTDVLYASFIVLLGIIQVFVSV